MPRLLLVDDNPSIHKIAETLLASTDIQPVCVASAQEALNLVAQGERFDAALLDTMMAGMDGWELLDQLRAHPGTAGIPIAMMAGVLDTVDPVRLETAPIQGFLKKPVELRDLGSRVHALLEVRVEVAPPPAPEPSPFATFPTVPLSDLAEFRMPTAEPPVDEDLLLLTEADLWPELPPPPGTVTEDLSPFAEIPAEESLDLEELDLDSLKGMTLAAPVAEAPAPAPILPFESVPAPEPVPEPAIEVEPIAEETIPVPAQILPAAPETHELPDLGPEEEPTLDPLALAGLDSLSEEAFEPRPSMELSHGAPIPDPDFLSGLGEASITPDVAVVDWSDESEKMLGYLTPSRPLTTELPEPALGPGSGDEELDLGELESMAAPVEEFLPAEAEPQPVAEPPHPVAALEPQISSISLPVPLAVVPAGAAPAGEDLLRAITSDPALMDQLAKALVAKLSDQVLREIAWEVMPEMAERLNRH